MAPQVDVSYDEDQPGLDAVAHQLEHDARALLELAVPGEVELSILLTDDPGIRELNATWRQKDEPTDVLSFPQQEGEVGEGPLGDLVISLDTAAAQAREVGHELRTELRVLLAHGLAHLLGHDHLTDEQAVAMQAQERRWLEALGVPAEAGLVERAGGLR